MAHGHWHAPQFPASAARAASTAARRAGSSLSAASAVAATTCFRHCPSAAVAACHAAVNWRAGLSASPTITSCSHQPAAVTSRQPPSRRPRHEHKLPAARTSQPAAITRSRASLPPYPAGGVHGREDKVVANSPPVCRKRGSGTCRIARASHLNPGPERTTSAAHPASHTRPPINGCTAPDCAHTNSGPAKYGIDLSSAAAAVRLGIVLALCD